MKFINDYEKTPLHIACKKNLIKYISMLNDSNENYIIKNKNNKRLIESKTDNNIKNIIKLMV